MRQRKISDGRGEARAGESIDFIRPGIFWIAAFLFCCLESLMFQKLVLPLVP